MLMSLKLPVTALHARAKLAAAYDFKVSSIFKPAYYLMTANPKWEIEEKDEEIIASELMTNYKF